MEITTKVGVSIKNQSGIDSCLISFKKNIDDCQKSLLWWPMKVSLNKYPENIAPIPRSSRGSSITNGDSWVASIGIFLLL